MIKDHSWVGSGLGRLFRSRRVLSYSYPFAYYMLGDELFKDEMTPKERELRTSSSSWSSTWSISPASGKKTSWTWRTKRSKASWSTSSPYPASSTDSADKYMAVYVSTWCDNVGFIPVHLNFQIQGLENRIEETEKKQINRFVVERKLHYCGHIVEKYMNYTV